MKLYLLKYTALGRSEFFTWDCNRSVTIIANNEKEARDLAAKVSADEDRYYRAEERGMSIWQDKQYTKAEVIEFTERGHLPIRQPMIVSIDFNAG